MKISWSNQMEMMKMVVIEEQKMKLMGYDWKRKRDESRLCYYVCYTLKSNIFIWFHFCLIYKYWWWFVTKISFSIPNAIGAWGCS